MLRKEELIKELEKLVQDWKVRTSDDKFDQLQEEYDDTRNDCADELIEVINKAKKYPVNITWEKGN